MDALKESGKTSVTSDIQGFLNPKEIHVVNVASSAVAAQIHADERASHYTLQIPIRTDQYGMCQISTDSPLADKFR